MKRHIFVLAIFSFCSSFCFAQQPLLEKYRGMALDYNHDLKAAERSISVSMELEKSARADRKPKVAAGANFQYTGNPMELTFNAPFLANPMSFEGQNMQYGASVSLLQPIYTGGRLLESIRIAQERQSLAANSADMIRSEICFQTDIQYWSTVARYEMIGIATEFRDSMLELVKIIKQRVEVGLVDPQDLLMAEVKLNEAEYQLLQAQNNFETGRMALNSIIGVELSSPTEMDKEIPMVIVPDSLFQLDGNNRAELKMALDRVQIAESSLKLNDSKYKPQFYVGADGSYSAPGYNFKSDLNPNYAVYAKVSIPIFEWGKRRSEKRAAGQQVGIETDNMNRVTDNIMLEVQTSRLSLTQAIRRVDLAHSSLEKASENEQKALERYAEGKISTLEVIDAQIYRQTSQIYYTQSKTAAQGHYSELIKAVSCY